MILDVAAPTPVFDNPSTALWIVIACIAIAIVVSVVTIVMINKKKKEN